MIESGPKIEESGVIKKEISEYAPTCAFILCFLLVIDILLKQFEHHFFVNHFEKSGMPSL